MATDTDPYLVVARVSKRLAVSKQLAQKFYVDRFILRKLRELEAGKQFRFKISKRTAALENLNDYDDINGVWENIKRNIKPSAKESLGLCKLKQHQAWFDEEYLSFLDQRKLVKMQ
jgi:hypothetical protein